MYSQSTWNYLRWGPLESNALLFWKKVFDFMTSIKGLELPLQKVVDDAVIAIKKELKPGDCDFSWRLFLQMKNRDASFWKLQTRSLKQSRRMKAILMQGKMQLIQFEVITFLVLVTYHVLLDFTKSDPFHPVNSSDLFKGCWMAVF